MPKAKAKPTTNAVAGVGNQPISHVEWVKPSALFANNYNPNKVAPIEFDLLEISILEDGWTGCVVARPDGEIIDGFHRWTLIQKRPAVAALTGGLVPVVRKSGGTRIDQMLATIRHNRARGNHGVIPMAEIVRELIDVHKMPRDALAGRLGMDDEEVDRLYDRAGMTKRGASPELGKAWVPSREATAAAEAENKSPENPHKSRGKK